MLMLMLTVLLVVSCGRKAASPPSPAAALPLPELVPQQREQPLWSRDACPVPQAPGVGLFNAVPSGPIEGGVLVCSLRLTQDPPRGRRWDAFGNAPDPMAEIRVGDGPVLERACGHDTYQSTLTWPGIDLPVGVTVSAHVYDLDIARHDDVGTGCAAYAGEGLLEMSGGHFSMRCGALNRAAVEALVPEQVGAALRSVVLVEQATLAPMEADWGYPHTRIAGLQGHTEALAGLVTWADPRVGGLLALHDGTVSAWRERATADVAAHAARLGTAGALGDLSV